MQVLTSMKRSPWPKVSERKERVSEIERGRVRGREVRKGIRKVLSEVITAIKTEQLW